MSAIETYLARLRQLLGGSPAERFLSEVHDHLLDQTAAGIQRGLAPEAAEARTLDLFGPPELIAHQYTVEQAGATLEKYMHLLRLIGLGCALLTLYYARFYLAVRQENSSLVQIGLLLAAAAVLALPVPGATPGAGWFRGWRPVSAAGWLTALAALGLAVAVFWWADHDSHSGTDTLNRAVPTLCLILAVALRTAYQQDERRRVARGG